jgi:hypothetical protein
MKGIAGIELRRAIPGLAAERERRGSCSVESGVTESVECADEIGKRWDTHGEIY